MKKSNNKKGFTLIELLIVVSIIALLASIVVTFLNDARAGARNNRRNELARQYVNVLEFYFSGKGIFPTGGCTSCGSATYVCLGDGYPGDSCYVFANHSESATVNSQLSEYAPSMPPLLDSANAGGQTYLGAAYGCIDATCQGYKLSWVLEGEGSSGKCAGGAVEVDAGPISICTYTSSNKN